jgi:hypothetical protein
MAFSGVEVEQDGRMAHAPNYSPWQRNKSTPEEAHSFINELIFLRIFLQILEFFLYFS